MVGVSTAFYGFGGRGALDKVSDLVRAFQMAGDICPLIELNCLPGASLEAVVSGLNRLKREYGVQYLVHQSMWLPADNFFLNPASANAKTRAMTLDALRASIDFAGEIGALTVSFHPGAASELLAPDQEFMPPETVHIGNRCDAYAAVRDGLQILLKYCHGGTTSLSIENLNYRPEKGYLFSEPEDMGRLPHGIGICLDLAHAFCTATKLRDKSLVDRFIDLSAGRITEVHLSDNDGSEDQHRLVGFGSVPFARYLMRVAKVQALPPAIIEASKRKYGYSDQDLSTSIATVSKLMSEAAS